MMWSGNAYADDPDKSEYDAAIAAVPDGTYYLKFDVDGVDWYLTTSGGLVDDKDAAGLFEVTQVSGGALYDVGFLIYNSEMGTNHFSNTTLNGDVANLNPGTGVYRVDGSNNRNDWERQVFFMNEEGLIAIRSCNTTFGTSSWADAGRAFWTYEIVEVEGESSYPSPCYSYEPAYIWTLETPPDYVQIFTVLNGVISTYEEQYYDLRDEEDFGGTTMNMGTDFGQHSDWDSWYEFWDLLQEIYAITEQFDSETYEWMGDEADCPTVEQAHALKARADELYNKILASEVPYTVEDGYYRIVAHNIYTSKFDEKGFVNKAIAASFDDAHANKAVYGTIRRNRADYLWKLTKSESGDSILLQNAGLGTYISFASDVDDNKIFMTDDINDASYVVFDYVRDDDKYVEWYDENGELQGDDKDIFCIRLARSANDPYGRYVHQMGHSSVANNASFSGNYGTDSGEDQELGFWQRCWDTGRTTDKWCSEWYLEFVPDDEAEEIIEHFEAIFNHDKLVSMNKELREKVAETLALAKDEIRTKMITFATADGTGTDNDGNPSQLTSPYSDSAEGTNLVNLIDNNPDTFWHTDWHGEAPAGMTYVTEDGDEIDCHYLQISGMDNLVGNCELYLRERAGADNDRVAKVVLMGADNVKADDEDYEEIAVLTIPNTGKGEESYVPFHLDEAYPVIRLLVIETAYSQYSFRTFWHAAEIQFYTVEENPNSQFNMLGEVAQTLQDTYDANCAVPDDQITPEIYQALLDAYNTFLASGLVDPAELRAALDKYAKATECVVEGKNPGQWSDMTVANAYNDLYAEVQAYNKAGKYKTSEMHRYAVMLKAMQKSLMEQANGIETDKWYRIMYPTEAMFDAYNWSKEGGDKTGLRQEDQGTMFGDFVTTAKEVSEEESTTNDDGETVTTTVTHLEAIGGEDLRESDRLFFMAEDEIDDKDASMFRFVESEGNATDVFNDVKENMLMALDLSTIYTQGEPLITSAAQFSSNASYPGNDGQKLETGCLIDGNTSTYWHSDYSRTYCAVPYLQVALNEPVSGFIQVYVARRNTNNGHVVRMYVQGSNDAENWTNIGYIETPYVNATTPATSQPIDLGGTFSHLRFTMTQRYGTDGGSNIEFDPFAENLTADDYNTKFTYFHASEFQIYPVTPNVQPSASVQALQQAYATANKVVLKDATAEDLAAAAQAYKAFQTEFNNKEGKAVLPNSAEKASVYAIQNKATGLFVFVDGTGNQNFIYLKTIPTMVSYKPLGYERSLLSGKNLAGQSTNCLHAGESNRRFCTWGTTDPTTNSGLVICEADEEYVAPAYFSFYKNVKPGRIIDWCHSVTISESHDLIVENGDAYTALGQYTLGEDEDAETYLALKAVLTIPAGEPALYIYGDTTYYDAEDDYMEPVKFTIAGDEKPVFEGKTVNGLIGTLVTLSLDKYLIYFNANYAAVPAEGQSLAVTPCSAVLDLEICPQVEADPDLYDFSICLGQAAKDVEVGVKDISSAIEKISQPGNVYSVDGKLLRSGATLNSLKALGKGMYILNGVKVYVK